MEPSRRRRFGRPQVWVGLAITVFCVWLALRNAPFGDVGRVIAQARWGVLLGISIPAYVLTVYLRALRWRHLTDPIKRIGTGALFRGVSVGFLVNNIFPLRVGEVVRAWYLGRETGASVTALFVTVILERVIDTVIVVGLAFAALAIWGARGDGVLEQAALLLLPVAVAPLGVLVALRLWPERVVGLTVRVMRPFPERLSARVVGLLQRSSDGLGALSGGRHLFWIGFHSLTLWLGASALPMLAGFWALDVHLGGPLQMLGASWLTLAAVGMAVALPSAPGFFGPYHLACKVALVRFGIPADTAVALGTLFHAVFWFTFTGLGLVVLRVRRTSLSELGRVSSGAEDSLPQ